MIAISASTRQYEKWLGRRLTLIRADLDAKHEAMAKNAFAFLRGSFFRWVEVLPKVCGEIITAPQVLGVGDLHLENFGTWRDSEGRLVWGVNDFDEAASIPYTNDLVRLCTSAMIAVEKSSSRLSARRICEAVLEGYHESLTSHGAPIVLGGHHAWLRVLIERRLETESKFWAELAELDPVRTPTAPRRLLARSMPKRGLPLRVVHRVGGLGSLGRQRFTATAPWCGALIAREAKALTYSAWHWRLNRDRDPRICYERLTRCAVRLRDPTLRVEGGWVVRRRAPDCRKIELKELSGKVDLERLLKMMGWETANLHLGTSRQRKPVLLDLKRRAKGWLQSASEQMAESVEKDWRAWKK